MTKMLSASGGFAPDPLTRGSAPGPRWGLCPQAPVIGSVLRTRHGAPQPLTPSAAYDPLEKICGLPCLQTEFVFVYGTPLVKKLLEKNI